MLQPQGFGYKSKGLYRPFLTNEAFKPHHLRGFGSFLFEDPPAPQLSEVQKLLAETQAQLTAAKAAADASKQYKDDMLRFKQERTELAEKLATIEASKKAELDKALASQGEFKPLYEAAKAKSDELQKQIEGFKSGLVKRDVRDKIRAAALKAGLKTDLVEILDTLPTDGTTPEFTMVGDTVKVTVHGVEEYVQALKASKPSLFGTPGTPGVNAPPPTSTLQPGQKEMKISPADLEKMRTEKPTEYEQIMQKALNGELSLQKA